MHIQSGGILEWVTENYNGGYYNFVMWCCEHCVLTGAGEQAGFHPGGEEEEANVRSWDDSYCQSRNQERSGHFAQRTAAHSTYCSVYNG